MELSESAANVVAKARKLQELEAQIKDRETLLENHKEAGKPIRLHARRSLTSSSLPYCTDFSELTQKEIDSLHDHMIFLMGTVISRKKKERNDLVEEINSLIKEVNDESTTSTGG